MVDKEIQVIKRDGTKETLNLEKIHNILEKACDGITGVSVSDIAMKAHLSFYDGITTKDIHNELINAAADLISENSVNYQYVAGNLLNYEIRKQAWGGMNPPRLYDHIVKMVELNFYSKELLEHYSEEEWNKMDNIIDHDRDFNMAYIGVQEYMKKYAVRDRSLVEVIPLETPQITYMLISALCSLDKKDLKSIKSFYNDFSQWDISLPTPIMAGLRTPTKQFSSCFPAGQKVWTETGLSNIEDVQVGDKILAGDGSYQPVVAVREKIHEDDKFIRMSTAYSIKESLVGTADHKVYALKKRHPSSRKNYSIPEYTSLENLEKGDFVHIPVNRYVTNDLSINLIDYCTDDNYILCDDGYIRKKSIDDTRQTIYDSKVNPIKNNLYMNGDIMRMLGYYLAEGHVNKNGNSVSFTFSSTEHDYINDVNNIIKHNFGIEGYIDEKKDHSTQVIFYSKPFKEFILNLCGTGFNNKFLSDKIIRMPYDLQKQLLIGVIRGDGCIHNNGMRLSLSNCNLIMQLSQIMIRCNLYPSVGVVTKENTNKYKEHKTFFRNGDKNKEIKYNTKHDSFIINMGVMANLDFLLEVDKNPEKLKSNFQRKNKTHQYTKIVNGEYFSKVLYLSEEKRKNEKVYDLQVDNVHSFTVYGHNVHNCTLISSDDTLDSIIASSGAIAKYASKKAGIGIDASRIRAVGSPVGKERAVKHTGVIPFFRMFEGSLKSCSQGGVRGASATLTVSLWHLEIEDILVLKNNKGTPDSRVKKIDYSIQINNYLYNRLVKKQPITLFSPSDVPNLYDAFFEDSEKFKELYEMYEKDDNIRKKVVSSSDLFTELMTERKETGRIYVFNVDNVNTHTNFKKKITTSNLCQEITLPTTPLRDLNDPKGEIALCTLAAINLGNVRSLDSLEKVCKNAVRALDNILSYQDYMVEAARTSTMLYRPLGIGITNLAYYLAKNGVSYSSKEGHKLIHETMEAISFYCIKASMELAKERGSCDGIEMTKWYGDVKLPIDHYHPNVDKIVKNKLNLNWEWLREEIKTHGIRNATLTAMMPAESSSRIFNSTNGVEPIRDLITVKGNKHHITKQVAPEYMRLKNKYDMLWDMKEMDGVIKSMAVIQKFTCQSISTNLSYNPLNYKNEEIPLSTLLSDLLKSNYYGLKTLYYHNTRDGREDEMVDNNDKYMVDSEANKAEQIEEEACDSCTI